MDSYVGFSNTAVFPGAIVITVKLPENCIGMSQKFQPRGTDWWAERSLTS